MKTPILEVSGLGKRYPAQAGPAYETLRESLRWRRPRGAPAPERWALRGVSFRVDAGEAVAVVGRNGAGKSTLLKVLSRVTPPTEGRAVLGGRVGALLEVGTGFHPELTGRENVLLNGVILGMSRREVLRRFAEIIDFAELRDHVDVPVKHYSSGMYTRLAFAVAAHLEPEVLLVDEVLAVGDLAFQRKCLGKMDAVSREAGRTILFVSHNLPAVLNLCPRALLIEGGALVADGPAEEVVARYTRLVAETAAVPLAARVDRQGSGALRFLAVRFSGPAGALPRAGDPLTIELDYAAPGDDPLRHVHVAIGVLGPYDERLFHLSTVHDADLEARALPPRGTLTCVVPRLPLRHGTYRLNIYGTVAGAVADWIQGAGALEVLDGDFFGSGRMPPAGWGSLLVAHSWTTPDA